jgi:hypothetical protein
VSVIACFGNVLTFLFVFFSLEMAPGPGFRSENLRGELSGCNCVFWECSNIPFWFFSLGMAPGPNGNLRGKLGGVIARLGTF